MAHYYLYNKVTGQPAEISNHVYASRLLAKVARDRASESPTSKTQRIDVVEISKSARLRLENEARRGLTQ